MQGFTIVDAGVAGIILISALLAYSRGFIREVLTIVSWVAAAAIAFPFAGQAEPLIKEIPVVGEFLRNSCELSMIASFIAVFGVALIIFSVFTPLFSSMVQKSALSGFDSGLGFLFGILRGVVLVAVAFFAFYNFVVSPQDIPVINDSRSAALFLQTREPITQQIPTHMPEWITSRYQELTQKCVTPTTGSGGPKIVVPGSGA